MKKIFTFMFIFIFILVNNAVCKEKLPQRGVLISSLSNVSANDVKVPPVWGGVALDGTKEPPISAQIVKKSSTSWDLMAENNSNDKYIFTLEFIQFSDDGKQVKKNVFPFSLEPKTNKTSKIVPSDRGEDYIVNIISWKRIETKKNKKQKEIKAEQEIKKTIEDKKYTKKNK